MDANIIHSRPPQRTAIVLIILSLLVISFITYYDILTYFFTAADTLTLIDTSRIESLEKAIEIFKSPLMDETSFATSRLFYRPVSSLSYALDYFLWQLNPFGYHLTDLVLHMLVCAFVFCTLFLLTHGRKTISWMSAVIFAIHPILVENVPAIARRQDTLMTLFVLISFFLFLFAQKRRNTFVSVLSLFFYGLALGSKETAFFFPILLIVYLFIFSMTAGGDGKSISLYAIQASKKSFSYFLVTLVFFAWRRYVLGGLGGYMFLDAGAGTIGFALEMIEKFFSSLVFPVTISASTTQLLTGSWGMGSLALLGKLYSLNKESIIGLWFSFGIFRRFCTVIFGVSVIGVLGYPFYTNFVQGQVLVFLFILLILSLVGLFSVGIVRDWTKRLLSESWILRTVIFLMIWLLLHLSILLATRTFQIWNMYISTIPFSALVSIALIEPIQYSKSNWKRRFGFPGLPYVALWSSFTAAGVVAYLFLFSPLFHRYDEWRDSGKLSFIVLDEISRISAELPPGTTLRIQGLPDGIASYSNEIPHVRSVRYLQGYSIKSWLEMTNPGGEIEIVTEKYSVYGSYPKTLNFNVQLQQDGSILIIVEPTN